MEKEILLNDQGIKFKCIIDNDNIVFEFPKSLEFLKKLIKIDSFIDARYARIGLKRILRIKDNGIEKMASISTTELRVLRAIYNNIYMNNKKTNLISNFKAIKNEIKYAFDNMNQLNKKRWEDKRVIKSELHTNLIGMLSSNDFIDFLNGIDISFPLDYEGNLNFEEGKDYSYKDIVINGWEEKINDALRLPLSDVSNFNILSEKIRNRERLLKIYIDKYTRILSEDKEWLKTEEHIKNEITKLEIEVMELDRKDLGLSKDEINKRKQKIKTKMDRLKSFKSNYFANLAYSDLLDFCIDKIDADYSEISISNEKRLRFMCDTHKNNNRVKFLYSIDRFKSEEKYKDAASHLESMLESKMTIGVEITGFEHDINDNFKDKLEWILPVLHMHPNSILRVHAGEFKDSSDNIYNALLAIQGAAFDINKSCMDLFGEEWGIVPPPRIRIGHSVTLEKNPELIKLIKEMGAVVEFSVSSSYALGNVNDLSKLPIDYYDKEGIDYIITTDGAGIYSTSLNQEQNIINNSSIVNVKPTKQAFKGKYVENASETEEREVEESKKDYTVKEKDKNLYERYMEYKSNKGESLGYDSYTEALEAEKSVFFEENKDISEYEKVNLELFRIRRYIMDTNPDINYDYVRNRLETIERYNEDKRSDFAKIFLYLLEREVFTEIDSSFKSLEYLSYGNTSDEFENDLRKLFKMVSDLYYQESYISKNR
ncbi:MAG: hypothetical protein IKR57_02270 [Bacilli bacterium]|nr:hypothetical protein [Bacilli bacterium]